MPELKNKVAVVTGAGSGIGEGIARVLARCGAVVVVNDVHEANGKRVAAALTERGHQCLFIKADVSSESQVREMVARTVSSFGSLDILVNNAGVNFVKPTLEMNEADWERVISVDLKGTFLCSQAALREMARQKGGAIINIASVHCHATLPAAAPYAAAKGGVMAMTKSMAIEFAPLGIRINVVNPGLTDTQIWSDIKRAASDPKEAEAFWMAHIPIKRVQQPEEVGNLVAFLASDEASYITGASIMTDGGMTAMLIGESAQAVTRLDRTDR
ncbi:MAG: 3-oxoacyl-ACP reductase FabG [Planctomycetes bacterium]|nr:3-oxoacyl-ACP reductase FabG [Planctomycetota bacterium]